MPIIRSKSQTQQSLREYYSSQGDGCAELKKPAMAMLKLLDAIDERFPDLTIWGLTSMGRLILMNQATSEGEWLITIAAWTEDEIKVEYLLPKDKAPWPDASVSGIARSIPQAIDFLTIAMRESGGWKSSDVQ